MKVAYLAGPMTGLPEFNFPAFHAATSDLRMRGYAVFNPAETAGEETGLDLDKYIRVDLALIQAADVVVVLPGWQSSRGAKAEVIVATLLGMPVMEYGPDTAIEVKGWDVEILEEPSE